MGSPPGQEPLASLRTPDDRSHLPIVELTKLRHEAKDRQRWTDGCAIAAEFVKRRGSFGDLCWLAWFQHQSGAHAVALQTIKLARQIDPSNLQARNLMFEIARAELRQRWEETVRRAEEHKKAEDERIRREETIRRKRAAARLAARQADEMAQADARAKWEQSVAALAEWRRQASATHESQETGSESGLLLDVRSRFEIRQVVAGGQWADIDGNVSTIEKAVVYDNIERNSIVFDSDEHANAYIDAQIQRAIRKQE